MSWQFALVSLALIAALLLLVVSCHRVPRLRKRRSGVRINPMFSRDWKEKP